LFQGEPHDLIEQIDEKEHLVGSRE